MQKRATLRLISDQTMAPLRLTQGAKRPGVIGGRYEDQIRAVLQEDYCGGGGGRHSQSLSVPSLGVPDSS